MECPSCHKHNPAENRFCWNCGTRLKTAPADGDLGQARPRQSAMSLPEEERAREKKRVQETKRKILVRGVVVGAIVAGAIGAFVGVMTGLMPAPRSQQTAALSITAYATLSGFTSALQGAVAGAVVGAVVAVLGGGGDTGWRAGALVNVVAYLVLLMLSVVGWGGRMALMGTGSFQWSYLLAGLVIWALWGGLYGWLIGAFVESSLDRW